MTLKRLNCLLAVFAAFACLPVSGQTIPASLTSAFSPVPFGPGERMIYKVELGMFGKVGNGAIQVEGIDTVHGYPTYRLRMDLEGGIT
ncbi:MAG TPA: hypothetical protein VK864_02660, partial [Longimicrobiales bacterium]|nr:hypothetical protein [Longimicrobiales bacterium]